MKKRISMLLAVILLVSAMSGFAFAADKKLTTEDFAYMDISSASDELRSTILEARESIIYGNEAWTVDGAVSIVRADGTIEALPEFSDLYPGWDLPERASCNSTTTPSSLMPAARGSILFSQSVWIRNPTGLPTDYFYAFNATGQTIVTVALTLPGATFNVGYTNEDTLQDLGWIPNLKVDQVFAQLRTTNGVRYSVRASTFDAAGHGLLQVKEV